MPATVARLTLRSMSSQRSAKRSSVICHESAVPAAGRLKRSVWSSRIVESMVAPVIGSSPLARGSGHADGSQSEQSQNERTGSRTDTQSRA